MGKAFWCLVALAIPQLNLTMTIDFCSQSELHQKLQELQELQELRIAAFVISRITGARTNRSLRCSAVPMAAVLGCINRPLHICPFLARNDRDRGY